MKKILMLILTLLVLDFNSTLLWALEQWTFKKTYESKKISENEFNLAATADLNGNKTKEIFLTDFGSPKVSDVNRSLSGFNLYVLEWHNDQLKINYHKRWEEYGMRLSVRGPSGDVPSFEVSKRQPLEAIQSGFRAFNAFQLASWKIGKKAYVETVPPYFAVQWGQGKYDVADEQVWDRPEDEYTIGSWALPWMSPYCYFDSFPLSKLVPERECLVGIRDFAGTGRPKILSIVEQEIVKDKQYKQILRIRDFNPGFKMEWEMQTPDRLTILVDPLDAQDYKSKNGLLLRIYRTGRTYLFEQDENSKKYHLRSLDQIGPRGLKRLNLPDLYLRTTQKRDQEEYWGYRLATAADGGNIALLRKVDVINDFTSFKKNDIDFKHHEPFLGVAWFIVDDVDNDGIDEIILVERTGKRVLDEDMPNYSDVKEYVQILKWNGQTYQTVWVSPPYAKVGTKFLVDDVKNAGKKQLVVLTPRGIIEIWERQ